MLYTTKQPSERQTVSVDFGSRLLGGVTIASATATGTEWSTGTTATNTILQSGTGTVNGESVEVTLKAGQTDGTKYKVTILATLSNSDILEEDLAVEVIAE